VASHPISISGHEISFTGASFTYPGNRQKAIDNISFTIPQGKTYALVGASGSGKTTIARLVPRFWDADTGQVTIGGSDVKDIAPKELMQQVSFVFQNTRLFKTTLLENICYGNPHATDQAIEHAVNLAQCREIIDKLPHGLNTKIGTQGTYLSGGEQQRIAMARAILKDAPIVVRDEATAFSDPENEHLIQKALEKLTQDKTVLTIAHRLTSVVDVDSILVLDAGKIAEQGNHRELIHRQGEITALVGPSGGGKSTSAKLAARFWNVDSGKILLGNQNISEIEPETLLENYSVVFQDVVLFNTTIMDNIRIVRRNATDEAVLRVARLAQCDEFVRNMPKGYQTVIGENGQTLSGGERQRISIARALLKDAPIVLLDEATASLDVENETKIQAGISELIKDKTVLIIAHRMRTVANADKIVVLENGRVIENGTPDALKLQNGVFAQMVERQMVAV